MSQEIDYQTLIDMISMNMVLQHYRVDSLRKRGNKLYGRCPLHACKTFQVDPTKNTFQCSESKGDVIDFVAAKERCETRDAAFWLAGLFGLDASVSQSGGGNHG